MSQGWRSWPFAEVAGVVDGDTLSITVDQGFDSFQRVRVRVYGVNCPERGRPGYAEATEFSAQALGKPCQLWTWRKSFDRYVGRLLVGLTLEDLGLELLRAGHALAWDGRGEAPTGFDSIDRAAEMAQYEAFLMRDFQAT